ncbi:MAG: TM2 domain-containing protein [Gemmatimonadetes bacterium]|nr:TM2 domain-containing protein [Gemmatimonadota bacterium]
MSEISATEESDRLRSVAVALSLPLGVFGAHRFYVGKTGTGLLQLGTLGGLGLWWLYDLILIMSGEFRDAEGRRVSRWSRDDIAGGGTRADRQQLSLRMTEEMETMQNELRELEERVDFVERLLAKTRDVEQLKGGK